MINKKIGVIGAGSWGTALAMLLDEKGNDVTLWAYLKEEAEEMQKTHKHKNLDNAIISESIKITTDMKEAVEGKEVILIVVPSNAMRSNIENIKPYVTKDQLIINCSKGVEEGTLLTMSEVISDVLPDNEVAILSGPSHAEEVAINGSTTCIIATKKQSTAKMLQELFYTNKFRIYISSDMMGVEIGGSLKNIIALATGICDGAGLGDNTKAALITRGLAEISRLGVKMDADLRTFYGLSGLGDLIVTCNSMHSRNRRCGIMLGEGKKLEDIKKEIGMVIEGVNSAKAGLALAEKYSVEMPIVRSVNRILFEGVNPKEEEENLMTRTLKEEVDAEMKIIKESQWKGE